MIFPTVGRDVWYRPNGTGPGADPGVQPLAAKITYVWSETMVNLVVFDTNGNPHSRTSVVLHQDPMTATPIGAYAEWIPSWVAEAALKSAA